MSWINICNQCSCHDQHQCSIVGYFPIGFCCNYCISYNETQPCDCRDKLFEGMETSSDSEQKIKLLSADIEGKTLKITIDHEGKKKPFIIDLKKYLESK